MRLSPEALSAIIPTIAVAFGAAFIAALALTPLARYLAERLNIVDRPDERRVNTRPVARGGGLAVAGAFVGVASILVLANQALGFVDRPAAISDEKLAGLLAGGLLAAFVGAADDFLQIRARWQLLGQIGVALVAVGLGVTVDTINNPLGPAPIRLDGPMATGFSLVWIVGMINSINFIDGLDGLASGIAFVAALTLGLISLTATIAQPFVAMLCFSLAGALLGFLRFNFHPASIFVGTSGVMFIGYSLALLSIMGTAKVAVALLVLAVPIIDAFWIIVRRLAAGRSPFTPDRGHIHHRLLEVGLSHVQTVVLIYGSCTALAIVSLALNGAELLYAFLVIVVAFGLLLLALSRRVANGNLVLPESSIEAARPARAGGLTSEQRPGPVPPR